MLYRHVEITAPAPDSKAVRHKHVCQAATARHSGRNDSDRDDSLSKCKNALADSVTNASCLGAHSIVAPEHIRGCLVLHHYSVHLVQSKSLQETHVWGYKLMSIWILVQPAF